VIEGANPSKLDADVQLKQMQQLKTRLAYAEDVIARQKNLSGIRELEQKYSADRRR
jgi:hypothetical protein